MGIRQLWGRFKHTDSCFDCKYHQKMAEYTSTKIDCAMLRKTHDAHDICVFFERMR